MASMSRQLGSSSYLSSTSSLNARGNYDVFVSYRGTDIRQSFTDHLQFALDQRGFDVFKDGEDLLRGKAIKLELMKAIEESRLFVVIFSENYASSTWCLDEVVEIVRCMKSTGRTVLPIFYHVDPSEVRKQTGKYQHALNEYEETLKIDKERVGNWRAALVEVANLAGWELKDQHESRFIQDIVCFVWNTLNPVQSPDFEDLVGMDSRLTELNLEVGIGLSDVRFIGICGMGGIGKTALAIAYYNWMCHQFECCAFLENVREEYSSVSGVLRLQEQLLCKSFKAETVKIWNKSEGIKMIKTRLCSKRVLIVIDDVDKMTQLQELAGSPDWFGSGSRIIITTRDERLLVAHGVHGIYKAKGLNYSDALQLFSSKAFKSNLPPADYMQLSVAAVQYTNGLPLALKVLGYTLCGKTIAEWKSALAGMKEEPEKEIVDTLKISFDALKKTEQKIFLDIACFFKGKDKHLVTKMLEDSHGFDPNHGIRVLIDKCLITLLGSNKLWMHDLIQELGRELVRQESPGDPGRRSRIWLYKDLYHVLTRNKGTEDVEGIIIDLPEPGRPVLNAQTLSNMTNLRLLVFRNVRFSHGLEYLSNGLRLLQWHEYPFKSLPESFQAEELTELAMPFSLVEQLWEGIKNFEKLKSIDLSYSLNLVKTPDFRGVPNLEKLILEGCTKLCEVDQSIGVLESLVLLNLKDCKLLVSLPMSMNHLKALESLNLSGCSKLKFKLEELEHVECLEELDLPETAIIQTPASFSHIKNLKRLFHGCRGQLHKNLIPLSPGNGSIPLSLSFHSFSGLCSLVELDLSDCNLQEGSIVSDFSSLPSLCVLNLSGNNFASLPSSICRLSKLEYLYLDNCKRLQSLEALPSNLNLKFLSARSCDSLETLPGGLPQMQVWELNHVPSYGFCATFLGERRRRLQSNRRTKFLGVQAEEPNLISMSLLSPHFIRLPEPADHRAPRHELVYSGSEIPNWFNYQTFGDSLSIHLPQVWVYNGGTGLAFCAVYSSLDHPFSNNSDILEHSFSDVCDIRFQCAIVMNNYHLNNFNNFFLHTYPLVNCPVKSHEDHIWYFYVPRLAFCDPDWQELTSQPTVRAKFTDLGGRFDLKTCGIGLVYDYQSRVGSSPSMQAVVNEDSTRDVIVLQHQILKHQILQHQIQIRLLKEELSILKRQNVSRRCHLVQLEKITMQEQDKASTEFMHDMDQQHVDDLSGFGGKGIVRMSIK